MSRPPHNALVYAHGDGRPPEDPWTVMDWCPACGCVTTTHLTESEFREWWVSPEAYTTACACDRECGCTGDAGD